MTDIAFAVAYFAFLTLAVLVATGALPPLDDRRLTVMAYALAGLVVLLAR